MKFVEWPDQVFSFYGHVNIQMFKKSCLCGREHVNLLILGSSALCNIAQSFDSALCRIAPSFDSALCRIAV
jgi:hypothetical protein